jgi:hypothetical protein
LKDKSISDFNDKLKLEVNDFLKEDGRVDDTDGKEFELTEKIINKIEEYKINLEVIKEFQADTKNQKKYALDKESQNDIEKMEKFYNNQIKNLEKYHNVVEKRGKDIESSVLENSKGAFSKQTSTDSGYKSDESNLSRQNSNNSSVTKSILKQPNSQQLNKSVSFVDTKTKLEQIQNNPKKINVGDNNKFKSKIPTRVVLSSKPKGLNASKQNIDGKKSMIPVFKM